MWLVCLFVVELVETGGSQGRAVSSNLHQNGLSNSTYILLALLLLHVFVWPFLFSLHIVCWVVVWFFWLLPRIWSPRCYFMVSPEAGTWMVRMLEQGENSCSEFTWWATVVSAFTSLVNAKLMCPCHNSKEMLSSLCCVRRLSLWLERDSSVVQDPGARAPSRLLPCTGAWALVSHLVLELHPLRGWNICEFGIMQLFKWDSIGLDHLSVFFKYKYIEKRSVP